MSKTAELVGHLLDRITGTRQLDSRSDAHLHQQASEEFWRGASHTYFGSSDYYARREAALARIYAERGPWARGLDIGCGDGRFTRQAAAHTQSMLGTDISPSLVSAARRGAVTAGVDNVLFAVADATDIHEQDYDLVLALGVTSCLVDDQTFQAFLTTVHGATTPGATVLTVDSLSRRRDTLTRFPDGYVARYRSEEDYVTAFASAGFHVRGAEDLGTPARNPVRRAVGTGRRVNRLFHFTRA